MTTTASPAVSSGESSRPSWVLLDAYARVGICPNETSATCTGRNGMPIRVSLVSERPPLPSNLYVNCSDATIREIPYLLSMVDDLILFHLYIGPSFRVPSPLKSDFFVYRADPKRPSLQMLPHPKGQVSRYDAFGIFPRGEDHYTIAALIPSKFNKNLFSLHLCDSETEIWSMKKLSVESPRLHGRRYPLTSPSTTASWVPLPLPLKCTKPIVDPSKPLGDARFHRGVTFTSNGCLRLAEVEFDVVVEVPFVYDEETRWPRCETKNWTISTWTNKEMNNSYDAWGLAHGLHAPSF
ncbi:hypothetical protein ACQ4PT_047196 [Festuca glaucescens]